MRRFRYICLAACPLLVACGGGGQSAMDAATPPDMAGPMIIGQHGVVIDYFNGTPLAGFTVTDGDTLTTTTDATGHFVLPAPMGEKLSLVVTGPSYTHLYLPELTAVDADVNRGDIPIPDASSFGLAQQVLGSDPSLAVVYITLVRTGACTSLAGGTLTVDSPAGVGVKYFTSQGLPTGASFIDRSGNLPVAAVYDVPPGADLEITLDHPTCKLAPAGTKLDGASFTGHVQTAASEPGDNNSSLVLIVQ